MKKNLKKISQIALCFFVAVYFCSYLLNRQLIASYNKQLSVILQDRNGEELLIKPNIKGQYMRPLETKSLPQQWTDALIQKEDRFFHYHFGINPISIARSLLKYPITKRFGGSSTLTQQLVKTLLNNENNRTIGNKILEIFYAVSLELHNGKTKILKMYSDTAYFGNQAEGLVEASKIYFDAPPESLNQEQILELLATLNNPSDYPGTQENRNKTIALAERLNMKIDDKAIDLQKIKINKKEYKRKSAAVFEIDSLNPLCENSCKLTIDRKITDTAREILRANLDSPDFASVNNGAIIAIAVNKEKNENELLAIVGSPHPESPLKGYQINMAVRPRPIGSTAKPFIYSKAFEKGARPYTLVNDEEYKYDIATGFAFYPKNYDGKYRGPVTLHEALSNSLNIPSVKTLQFVGLENFYDFLKTGFRFEPSQPLENYALSIALGGLEMDLLTLANYFSIFPNEGILKPLQFNKNENDNLKLPMAESFERREILDKAFTQLTTKILSDRKTGIEQFGLKSNLNLPAENYAVKTGTSYDYHDSWTIGYTPDFVVGVWLGNSDNKPMYRLSGSIGAGKIWHEVMEAMLNSPYNKNTAFDFSLIKEFQADKNIEYGLANDDYDTARNLLESNTLILQPHDGDILQFSTGMKVPLIAKEKVTWQIDSKQFGNDEKLTWTPTQPGIYIITAKNSEEKTQTVKVKINPNEE